MVLSIRLVLRRETLPKVVVPSRVAEELPGLPCRKSMILKEHGGIVELPQVARMFRADGGAKGLRLGQRQGRCEKHRDDNAKSKWDPRWGHM